MIWSLLNVTRRESHCDYHVSTKKEHFNNNVLMSIQKTSFNKIHCRVLQNRQTSTLCLWSVLKFCVKRGKKKHINVKKKKEEEKGKNGLVSSSLQLWGHLHLAVVSKIRSCQQLKVSYSCRCEHTTHTHTHAHTHTTYTHLYCSYVTV